MPNLISAAESAPRHATTFHWKRIPDLPDPVGLKGAYAGLSNGWVLHAGGSNFPVPRSAGGAKAFSDRIYVRPAGAADAPWREASARLPFGLAEGATVTVDAGVIAIGGQTLKGPVADVFLLRADSTGERIERQPLPSLPAPCANATATLCNGSIYVAGGEQASKGMSHFWRLEVAAALANPAGAAWQSLPSWPGSPRFGAILVTLERDGREQLFLFSGRGEALRPTTIDEYLTDAYRFDPRSGVWAKAAKMPHPALIAAGVRIDRSRAAIMGGSDGHDLHRMAELGERYRIPDHIAIYDAATDAWTVEGTMPIGVVGAAVAKLDDGSWLVAGGEYSPSLRTAQAFRLEVRGGGAGSGTK
jgi:N-acetylneuraminic acid mutarotase